MHSMYKCPLDSKISKLIIVYDRHKAIITNYIRTLANIHYAYKVYDTVRITVYNAINNCVYTLVYTNKGRYHIYSAIYAPTPHYVYKLLYTVQYIYRSVNVLYTQSHLI